MSPGKSSDVTFNEVTQLSLKASSFCSFIFFSQLLAAKIFFSASFKVLPPRRVIGLYFPKRLFDTPECFRKRNPILGKVIGTVSVRHKEGERERERKRGRERGGERGKRRVFERGKKQSASTNNTKVYNLVQFELLLQSLQFLIENFASPIFFPFQPFLPKKQKLLLFDRDHFFVEPLLNEAYPREKNKNSLFL